ncbi:hypothetical protein T08_12022 [Trichinella sp. T8]|nr:hypothetical protein T08_12022 [Trichinella sp. T8]
MSNDGIGVNYELAWGSSIRGWWSSEGLSMVSHGHVLFLGWQSLSAPDIFTRTVNEQINKQTVENKFDNRLDGSVASTGTRPP